MKCPNCGKELKDGAKFCGGCGTKIESNATAVKSGGTVCPNCGKELKPGAKFCGGCGTKLGDSDVPKKTSATKPSGNSNASASNEKGFFQRMMNHIRKRDNNRNRGSGENSGGNAEERPVARIEREDVDVSGSCLHWNVLPGQLAVKIDYKTLDGCGKVKGIIIQDGTKALAFANGSFVGELPGGKYMFKNPEPVSVENKKSGFKRIVSGLRGFFKNEKQKEKLSGREDETFVIVRDAMFPLIFEFENVVTGPVTSSRIALHALAKISDVNSFYKEFLLDKQFVSFDFIAQNLNKICHTAIENILRDKSPDEIGMADTIELVKDELASRILSVFPFISVQSVVRVTAENDELTELRAMREELYVAEEKLVELQRRNDYLNRLTDENNAQILHEAQTQADFAAAVNKIDEQNLLTDDEKERFAMTLHAQRVIREATSNDEVVAALTDLQKAGLLRDEEIDTLVHQIAQRTEIRNLTDAEEVDTMRREIDQRARMQGINDIQAINLATLQNDRILDEEKLAWEIEVGNKRIENQIELQRLMDEYNDSRRAYEDSYSDTRREADAAFTDSRREADAAFEDSRRRSQIDLDKEEQQNQMDLLRQAQAIRQEREEAEHKRAMEARQAEAEIELRNKEADRLAHKDELDAETEKNRIYAGMSAEQIMAANPNISPAAAAALAAKFSNENAVEAQKQINEAQKQSNEQMMGMMQQFMAQMQADKNADREQQLQYMQMMANQNNIQMQQMGAMASNIAMGKAQDAAARLQDKEDAVARQQKAMDAEIARADKAADKLQDRMLDAMQTSVKAVSSIKTPNVTVQSVDTTHSSGNKKDFDDEKSVDAPTVCPNCGAPIEPGESFCGECGTGI